MADDSCRKLTETTLLVTCAAGREGDARRELRAALGDIDARPLFLRGNVLVTVRGKTRGEALSALAGAQTRTIARCVPVTVQADLRGDAEPIRALREAALAAVDFRPGDTFRVECRRRGQHSFSSQEVQRQVGLYLEERTPAAFRFEDPDCVVSVDIFQEIAYLGCQPRPEVVHKTITRMRIHAPGMRPLNRAEAKLREALEAFGVVVDASTRALDLGAAPGGWTKVLAERGAEVLAVDPAELAPEVASLPRVTHFRGHAEELLAQPDAGGFDLITNDMNRDPAESATTVRSLLPLLRPPGTVIMTVKFVTRRRRQHIREATDLLRPHFATLQVKRVPHNANETTIFLHHLSSSE